MQSLIMVSTIKMMSKLRKKSSKSQLKKVLITIQILQLHSMLNNYNHNSGNLSPDLILEVRGAILEINFS